MAKIIHAEGREATTDEKAQLVQFSGWGGLASAFEEGSRYLSVLDEVLTTEERQAAAASCLTAFYTPPAIITAVWQAVEEFGFMGGRVLEPGAGIGHFLGFSPPSVNVRSEWVAVEKDPIAGLMIGLLYPDATVEVSGFEQAELTNSSFDLVIGNVPFGAYSVYDRQNPDLSAYPIHNYFIGKSARLVKPGGLMTLITSSGTLDQSGAEFRQWLSRQAETELVGAIRLPSCAFETHTNTSVTTDVLFLQRREGVNRQFAGHSFERTVSIRSRTIEEDGEPTTSNLYVNEYFAQRPGQLLGEMVWADEVGKGGLYRADRPTLFLEQPEELGQRLTEAIAQLPKAFLTANKKDKQRPEKLIDQIAAGIPGSLRIKGRTYSQLTIIRQYRKLKETLTALLEAEREGKEDWEVEVLRTHLNNQYDEFTAFFGPLTSNRQLSFLETYDSRFAQVQALEIPQKEQGKTFLKKAAIFRERVNVALPYPTTAASVADAVNLSMWFHGGLKMVAITNWLAKSVTDVTDQLLSAGLTFIDPITGNLIERDAYLSGNIRQKLAIAEDKARNEPRYQANVYALQQIVPPTIPAALISFGLGSIWLPDELVTNFIQATLQLPDVSTRYNNRSRQYEIDAPTHFYSSLNQSLGTSHRTALQLIDAALNSRSVVITKTITQDGKERSVRDVEATSQAIAAQERLGELFVDFAREQYESVIEETFNRLYNTHVPRRFARPTFPHYPNANPAISLRDHQFRAVERIKIQDTMLAHAVGSGKTYTMITGAMELKRLGIARKPLLVVQNSTVEDVARSWRLLYPSAVVYVPQRSDLDAAGRKRFLQRIATNHFDGIIIPQSFLKLIPDDPASEQAFLQEEIDRVEAAVAAASRQDKSKKSLVKRLNELRLRLEARRLRQADRKKDNILSFDELGIDALFLDECHKYKRLGFFTSRRGIKGIDPAGSEDALSAMFKCRSVQARQGRVVLATGTPISNTMAEAWTMLRFIAPDHLDEARISTFDQFAGAFGQLIASFELTTTGQFKAVSRFARFVNVRQLSELYRAHVDVVLNDDVVEFQRDQTLPILKDGGFTKIVLPQTEGVQAELDTIRERLRWFEELTGSEKRENSHLPLVLFGQARKATLDIRLLSALNEDEPGSKLNRAATEIVRLYQQSDSYKGTQLVFADVYQSPLNLFVDEDERLSVGPRFNLFDDLKLKLVAAGIPANEVAVCPAEADKRESVFAKVRTGEIRVMLGTSERMGIGVNVQERLVGLHHLDAPNRPTDFEQRNGRIIRQGNLHASWGVPIEILTYGVDRTLDATAYGRLAIKQKFINQVLKGHLTDEGMNDISADDDFAAMSFDQMMATLSGSQYALAYAAKQLDLSRLLTARKNWQRGVLDAQTQVERARRILLVQVPLLPTLESEVAVLKTRFATDEQPDAARTYQLNTVIVESITYTEKFGGPVQQLLDRMRGQLKRRLTPQAVITVNGLPLTLTGEVRQDVFTLRNEYVFTYQWGSSLQGEVMSGPGLFQSLRQSVAHAPHLPAQCQQRIDRAHADEAAFIQKVNEPFRHSQKITQLEAEIADLQDAMLRESEPINEPVLAE
ncbi:DEAD/DEAH box helicase family protein [Spirosoma sp. 209]|uniref:Eco57I restriction-modification methylase domain-containing protein n=1 Tax=Spirosoma sp. 209 TaxID=1955701 RepID=UPI001F25C415|nr:DEAD/DEAH box helicase family protein [Spirosoma sp. 209]